MDINKALGLMGVSGPAEFVVTDMKAEGGNKKPLTKKQQEALAAK